MKGNTVALDTPASPTTALTDEVAKAWQRALNLRQPVAPDARFVDLGGDSLMLMAILEELEDAHDIELDVDAVLADLTVAGMARVVQAALADRGDSA